MMKVGIVGSGVVGGATGKGFSNLGHDVLFYDIYEEKLHQLTTEGFQVTDSLGDLIDRTDLSFICVGTPTKENVQDLSAVRTLLPSLIECIETQRRCHHMVFRSTFLPGTMRSSVVDYFYKNCSRRIGVDYTISYNPEFLRQVTAMVDFKNPDRVVIGTREGDNGEYLSELYKQITDNIIVTSYEAAELIKYAANCFLALKISYFNEIGMICEKMGINSNTVTHAVSLDRRIGKYGTTPGLPFGGACLPKDTEAFMNWVEKFSNTADLVKDAVKINNCMREFAGLKVCKPISNLDKSMATVAPRRL